VGSTAAYARHIERLDVEVTRHRLVVGLDRPVTSLESFWSGRPDVSLLAGARRDARHIVLVHEADGFDRLDQPQVALQLSGHTHGGQGRIPGHGWARSTTTFGSTAGPRSPC